MHKLFLLSCAKQESVQCFSTQHFCPAAARISWDQILACLSVFALIFMPLLALQFPLTIQNLSFVVNWPL